MKPSPRTVWAEVLTSRRVSHLVWTAALVGIAVLLVTVGLLQYRWNTQIRQATEIRVGADLESVMMKWHLDLYGELSTICIALQVGPDSGAHDQWNDYLRRYEEWRHTANNSGFVENIYSNPDVVSSIYIWETSRKTDARLLRFNADVGKIENSSKPPALQPLLAHLERKATNLRIALRAWELEDPAPAQEPERRAQSSEAHKLRTSAITGWQFDESIPAIVHPILHHDKKAAAGQGRVDWFVIVLDRDAIEHRIFPELAQRYFGGGKELEYKVAVVAVGATSRLLYSSDPGFGIQDMGKSDSAMNIFGPPPESTEGSFWQSVKNKESLRGEEWHSFSGPVWFPIIQQTAEGSTWMLFLQHRTAPLEDSITKVWRGNLIVGGVVLLLLAISMFLVMIATQRVRDLATLQMDFVASISHELRTPLAAMLSAGQNITDGFAPDLSKYGSIITSQARQLIDLVDQILLYAAMKDGKQQYQVRPVQLDEVLKSISKNTLPMLEQAGFHVDFQIEKDLPSVLGDRQAVFRCMQNLIENAVKYSDPSRWIGIYAQLDHSSGRGDEVAISVADHGVGIEHTELPHIFEPFYRGSRVIAAQIHGSGLGLSVVKHIVKAIGGTLTVTSEENVGSVFTLHLRVAEDPRSNNAILEEAGTSR